MILNILSLQHNQFILREQQRSCFLCHLERHGITSLAKPSQQQVHGYIACVQEIVELRDYRILGMINRDGTKIFHVVLFLGFHVNPKSLMVLLQ